MSENAMFRIFAAIEVPRDVGEKLQLISKKVIGASWRPIENYHITLAFFGEVTQLTAEALDEQLQTIQAPQMQLHLKSTGWFGGADPHSLWAGLKPVPALIDLAGKCERAGRHVGLRMERRAYRPHVTLAYCHGTPLDEAVSFCQKHAFLDIGPFWADRFHLYSSWFGKGPSRYVQETEYPLGPVRTVADLQSRNQNGPE